jgi:hypothetical protein
MKNTILKSLVSFGLLSLLNANAALAATFIVSSTVDGGSGSLREAMMFATSGDVINFDDSLSGTITLDSPLPLINGDLTITGNSNVDIDGQQQYQIFFANQGNINISSLSLSNGLSVGGLGGSSYSGNGGGGLGAGGAIFINSPAIVNLTDVSFVSNAAQGGDGGSSNSNYFDTGAGGGGGGGYNNGNGGNGGFSLTDGSGGGGGGGFASTGGLGFIGGGGGGGFDGTINNTGISGDGSNAGLDGGEGGEGFGGIGTGGNGGTGGSTPTNGTNGNALAGGGGGGGGGANVPTSSGGNGGLAGAIGGGGGGGGGEVGGTGGKGNDFGGGGGAGGSIGLAFNAAGGKGGFGGGGGGGGGANISTTDAGAGGKGGFGAGGGGGGKNADAGHGGLWGGNGGSNDGGGGGGAGLGGALFVRNGGTLTLTNCSWNGNSVASGVGGTSGGDSGHNGLADGSDCFLMENTTTTVSTETDTQLLIAGSGTLVKTGSEKLTLGENLPQAIESHLRAIRKGNFSTSIPVAKNSPSIWVDQGILALANIICNLAEVQANATLRGVGLISNLNSHGTVRPDGRVGNSFTTALIVTNNYTQQSDGKLSVEIFPNWDSCQLIVGGTSNIAGTLHINPSSGTYRKGSRFTVLTANKINGKFQTLQINGNRKADAVILYHPTYIEIEIVNSFVVL